MGRLISADKFKEQVAAMTVGEEIPVEKANAMLKLIDMQSTAYDVEAVKLMGRELPILFNADMVRAILDGRKTLTRRVCKDGNDYTVPDMSFYGAHSRTYAVHNYADKGHGDKLGIAERTCPICPGDILYVRETWQCLNPYSDKEYVYKASCDADYAKDIGKWLPSIHMPKEAARIWLKVTDVRVEQLWDISETDIFAEGVSFDQEIYDMPCNIPNAGETYLRGEFMRLWNSTIKKADIDLYGWKGIPWVWVIEFERCEKPKI